MRSVEVLEQFDAAAEEFLFPDLGHGYNYAVAFGYMGIVTLSSGPSSSRRSAIRHGPATSPTCSTCSATA